MLFQCNPPEEKTLQLYHTLTVSFENSLHLLVAMHKTLCRIELALSRAELELCMLHIADWKMLMS